MTTRRRRDYERQRRLDLLAEGLCPSHKRRKVMPGHTRCYQCMSAKRRMERQLHRDRKAGIARRPVPRSPAGLKGLFAAGAPHRLRGESKRIQIIADAVGRALRLALSEGLDAGDLDAAEIISRCEGAVLPTEEEASALGSMYAAQWAANNR